MPLSSGSALRDRLDQVAVEVLGDEVGDDFGVGVAVEDDAFGLRAGV